MKKELNTATGEDVFEDALRMLEAGMTVSTIIESHPIHAAELQQFFDSIASLESAQTVKPSPELLRSTLAKISEPLPSSFAWISSSYSKIGVSLAVLALVLLGGTSIVGGNFLSMHRAVANPHAVLADGTSDSALNQDAQKIDDQIGALDSDETQANQAVQQASSEVQ